MLGSNHVLVGAMRHEELRRAIEMPARRADLRIEHELAGFIEDPNAQASFDAAVIAIEREELRAVLATLSEREQRVLELRFGLVGDRPRTLEEVGREFQLTRERLRPIEAKALANLRHPAAPPGRDGGAESRSSAERGRGVDRSA